MDRSRKLGWTYGYDQYGNLWSTGNNLGLSGTMPQAQSYFNALNNQLTEYTTLWGRRRFRALRTMEGEI